MTFRVSELHGEFFRRTPLPLPPRPRPPPEFVGEDNMLRG